MLRSINARLGFDEPAAAKVPGIIALFWLVKVFDHGHGEATSDYLAAGKSSASELRLHDEPDTVPTFLLPSAANLIPAPTTP